MLKIGRDSERRFFHTLAGTLDGWTRDGGEGEKGREESRLKWGQNSDLLCAVCYVLNSDLLYAVCYVLKINQLHQKMFKITVTLWKILRRVAANSAAAGGRGSIVKRQRRRAELWRGARGGARTAPLCVRLDSL
jgi:hypothetical protein